MTQLLYSDAIVGFLTDFAKNTDHRPEILLSFGFVPKVETRVGLIDWLIQDPGNAAVADEQEFVRSLASRDPADKRQLMVDLYKRVIDGVADLGFPLSIHFEATYGVSGAAFETFAEMLAYWSPRPYARARESRCRSTKHRRRQEWPPSRRHVRAASSPSPVRADRRRARRPPGRRVSGRSPSIRPGRCRTRTASHTPTPTAAVPMIRPAAAFMTTTFGLATTSPNPMSPAPTGLILLSRLRKAGGRVSRVSASPTARRRGR